MSAAVPSVVGDRAGGKMIAGALSLLAGIVSALALPVMPPPGVGLLGLLFGAAVRRLCRARTLCWIPFGFGLAVLEGGAALADRLPTGQAGRDRLLEGVVETVLSERPGRPAFLFRSPAARGDPVRPGLVRLVWYDAPEVPAAGERWRLVVRLRDPRGTANPHGFDYERWLLARRIEATGYVRKSARNSRLEPADGGLHRARERISETVAYHLGDGESARVIEALVTGNRAGLSRGTRDDLIVTGTAHLLAISGLHVGIAAGSGALAGRLVARVLSPVTALSAARAGWFGAAAVACAYAALVGPSVATRRALIMVLVMVVAGLGGRMSPLTRGLVLAAWIVLLWDPLAVLDGGFWLSFGAVTILAARFAGRVHPPRRGAGLVEAQLAISAGMIVPSLALFGFVPTAGPAINLVAVPLLGIFVLPAGLVGAALAMAAPELAGPPLALAGAAVSLLLSLLELTVERGPGVLEAAWAGSVGLGCAALGGLLLLGPPGLPGRRTAPVLLLPVLLWQGDAPPAGGFDLTVLDVGQGLSVVVRTHAHALVYDGGPSWPGGDAGSMTVRPYLRGEGIRRLDALVVSHGDTDHAGGAASLLGLVAGPVLVGPGTGLSDARTETCQAGYGWEWDGVLFEFLHPPAGPASGGNDASCVLRIHSQHGSALLPGDIEARVERRLARGGAALAADLVVAAHHGSATSSSPVFVDATGAAWVIYAAGYRNRWSFPRDEVAKRWTGIGATGVTTGIQGAVTARFRPGGGGSVVATWRCSSRRFWRPRSCDADAVR